MKSRASCYDPSLARMQMRRFAPLVLLYTLGMGLLITVVVIQNPSSEYHRIMDTAGMFQLMGAVNIVYALVLCQLLFGDLYTPRLCYTIQALPITLGGYYGTQVTLAFLASLLPNVGLAIFMAPFLGQYSYIAWWWLEAAILQFIICFGIGAVAAVSAGNRVGMILIYGIIHLFAVLVYWAIMHIYNPLLYGLVPNTDLLVGFSPAYSMVLYGYVGVAGTNLPGQYAVYVESVTKQSFLLFYIYAAVGIVFLVLAMRLLRRRKMEVCGDLLAFPKSKPAFLLLFTLAAGICAHILSDSIHSKLDYLFLAAGMAVGFFVCEMLMQRQIQVFTKRNFGILGGIGAAVFLSLLLVGLDITGQEFKLPKNIQSIQTARFGSYYSPAVDSDTKEEIQEIERIHEIILQEYKEKQNGYSALERIFRSKEIDNSEVIIVSEKDDYHESMLFTFEYTLENGKTMKRQYRVSDLSEAYPLIRKVLSAPKYNLNNKKMSAEEVLNTVSFITFNCSHPYEYRDNKKVYLDTKSARYARSDHAPQVIDDPKEIKAFFAEYLKDCDEGTTASNWFFNRSCYDFLDIAYICDGEKEVITIHLPVDSVNTMKWLYEHGYHEVMPE